MFHFGCHGNQVTIPMQYVVDAYCSGYVAEAYYPKEPPYQI